MNAIDIFVMLFFGGIVLVAFMGGLGKVFSAIVGMYFGIIVAAFFYHPVAVLLQKVLPNMSLTIGELAVFVFLSLAFSIGFGVMLARTFVLERFPRLFGAFNNIGGGVAGILVALLATVLASMIVTLFLQALYTTTNAGAHGFMQFVQSQMQGSTLVPIFLKLVPTFITPLKPWFPRGLPPLLDPRNL